MDVESPESLRADVQVFLDRVTEAGATNPFVDVSAAERIVGQVSRVLDAWERLSLQQRQQAADTVAYVVTVDDEEHDLLSPIGLVDDEECVALLIADLQDALGS